MRQKQNRACKKLKEQINISKERSQNKEKNSMKK